jgi:hypothetical protein
MRNAIRKGDMNMRTMSGNLLLVLLLAAACTVPGFSSDQGGFRMEILVRGEPTPEYCANGTTYVEALRGKEYAIRLTNPLPVRVAVALSVDGLNTIDARHTDAWTARKWVLEPYETITIQGWQTSLGEARRFFFTSEANSYGAWLGKTRNLGVLSAVFFREKAHLEVLREMRRAEPEAGAADAAAPSAASDTSAREKAAKDEYAATGIGDRFSHPVEKVSLDLDPRSCASFSMRYEFRPALVRLGILPQPKPWVDPLERRSRAHGFDDMTFCPDPR